MSEVTSTLKANDMKEPLKYVREKNVPGSSNSKCKGPEARMNLV